MKTHHIALLALALAGAASTSALAEGATPASNTQQTNTVSKPRVAVQPVQNKVVLTDVEVYQFTR